MSLVDLKTVYFSNENFTSDLNESRKLTKKFLYVEETFLNRKTQRVFLKTCWIQCKNVWGVVVVSKANSWSHTSVGILRNDSS